nr:phosphopantetheine-binding protein [uncultured Methanobrevibacter sp.]
MNSIPLNVNGKVDKRALPKVDIDSLHAEYVAPRTENEKAIVKAFENVFNQENIGIYDDFVRLGGDSLTAIKLLPYLEDYNIAAADILSLRTPQSIANHIVENLFDSDVYSLDEGCPLNESQLNVYLDIVANNKFDTNILPLHMRISKEYDIDAIKNALEEILIIHPILGMCVSDEFEVPYLVKGSKPPIVIESDAMMII